MRTIISFVLSPLLAGMVYVAIEVPYANHYLGALKVSLIISYTEVIILGVPAFFLLRNKGWLNLGSLCLLSTSVVAVPWLIYALSGISLVDERRVGGRTFYNEDSESVASGGKVIITEGELTFDGLLYFLTDFLTISLCGALGGLIFWFLYKKLPLRLSHRGQADTAS